MEKKDATMLVRSTSPSALSSLTLAAALVVGSLGATGCVSDEGEGERFIGPGVIELRLPARFGALRRPAVEFDHTDHTEALAGQGCKTCHEVDSGHVVVPKFARREDPNDRNALMDLYHDRCIDCHKSHEDSGPVTCGECHVRRGPALSTRAPMQFDYSLHQRHVLATAKDGEDDCEACHHVVDEKTGELVRKRGTEEACGASGCHGEVDAGKNLSLRHASHQDCLSCHLERRAANQKAGPVACTGCHEKSAQAAFVALQDPPRLVREGMPDMVWIEAPGVETNLVAFDHALHERVGDFCSTCHHDSMKACKECHTLTGSPEGHQVTLEQAYHRLGSEHSCVGCHARKTRKRDCAGCHHVLPQPPAESSCVTCHNGPPAGTPTGDLPPTRAPLERAPLPPSSKDFPETITIDVVAGDRYGPSEFPHRMIVENLDEAIRLSKLASRFHVSTPVLCSGCHHRSPVGMRPPRCLACHDKIAAPTDDRPGLRAAYHRQCVGCHQQMGIEQQGCTDCHERTGEGALGKEVQP